MSRKARSDRGKVKVMARDLALLPWIIQMDEVCLPHLQVLIAKEGGRPTVTLSRVLQIKDRWERLGWVEYRNPYRDPQKPGSVYATRKAIKDFGYELPYRVRELASLPHLFATAQVRLWVSDWMVENGYQVTWVSERELRRENAGKYPDAVIYYGEAVVAIEVETTRKSKEAYQGIRAYYAKSDYHQIWYFHDNLEGVLRETFTESKYKFRQLSELVLSNGYTLFQKAG